MMAELYFLAWALGILGGIMWFIFPFIALERLGRIDKRLERIAQRADELSYYGQKLSRDD